jgi:hypothetical protein
MSATKYVSMLALFVPAAMMAKDPEPDVSGFKSYELPTYTIVTHDEGRARPLPRLSAQIQGVLEKLLNRAERAPTSSTYVMLIPESVWIRYLRPGPGFDSEFVPGRFSNYLLMNNARDASRLGKGFFHEYSHWFLHTQYPGVHPLWFDEGLAEFVTTAEFRGARARLGDPDFRGSSGWIPLEKLLRLDRNSPEYRSLSTSGAVLRGSWAIVHRGLAGDAAFGRQMFDFLGALNAQRPLDEAVHSSFRVNTSDLDKTIHAYLNPGFQYVAVDRFRELRLSVDPVPLQKLPRGRAMSELESLRLIADVMLASGFNSNRLPEVVNAVRRIAPGSSAETALRLRIAARTHDDASLSSLLSMIDPNASDPDVLRDAGLALFERAAKADRYELASKALELLDRALVSRPDDVEAVWAHAILAAGLERDLRIASDRVESMRIKLPTSPDLAQASAMLHQASGDTEKARQALRDTQRLSKDSQLKGWAMSRLQGSVVP